MPLSRDESGRAKINGELPDWLRQCEQCGLPFEPRTCGACLQPSLKPGGVDHDAVADAFRRLLDVADRDSGQPVKVRRFLLAAWNAGTFGGWDPSELWALDREIVADMLRVLGAYAHGPTGHYADHYGDDVARRMRLLAEQSATREQRKAKRRT